MNEDWLPDSHQDSVAEESYFISMTDLMVGMLFVFIIMLMAFVLNLRQAESAMTDVVNVLKNAEVVRSQILDSVRNYMQKRGIAVGIDHAQGVLHLPEEILFDSGKADLSKEGEQNLVFLARALREVLPCYSSEGAKSLLAASCPESAKAGSDMLEAVLIEGYTDSDPVDPRVWYRSNLGLSAFRAIATFRKLFLDEPVLAELRNKNGMALFGVSGYGDQRLLTVELSDADKRLNRRIDLRLLMAAPRAEKHDSSPMY